MVRSGRRLLPTAAALSALRFAPSGAAAFVAPECSPRVVRPGIRPARRCRKSPAPPSRLSAFVEVHDAIASAASSFVPAASSVWTSLADDTVNGLGRDIFTFLAASVVVVPVSRYIGVSPVLGFLALGCAIGPYGLEIFSNTEADLELGDFGILFLLFNEGLGLSPGRIKALRTFSYLGLVQIMISFLVFFVGTIFGGPYILKVVELFIPLDDGLLRPILTDPVQAFCIASAGALSSSAFVLPVLKQKGWEERSEGIAGLSILLLQDLAVAPLLVILPLIAGTGPQTSTELGWLVGKATIGFGVVLFAGSFVIKKVFEVVAASRSTDTFVAAALLVVISMGATADYLGLSASTGAFAAGVLLAGNRYRPQIQADIKPFEGILLGIFFMTAGANLDPGLVLSEWPTLLTGIAAFLVTKAAVLFAEGPALGLTAGEAARVALTLSGGGEFSFVLFKIAQDLGVLPDTLAKLLTASVIISMSLTPLLGEVGDAVGNYIEAIDGTAANQTARVGEVFSEAEAEALFDEIDADGSESIEIDELRDALLKLNFQYASIAEIFTAFDSDGDGIISRKEWAEGIDAGLLAEALDARIPASTGRLTSADSFSDGAVIICGFGKMGRAVYRMLDRSGVSAEPGGVVAFSLDASRVAAGTLSGDSVVFGDGARADIFRAAGVTAPRAVVITYASEARRLDATQRLRGALPPGTPILVRAGDDRFQKELADAGATDVVAETTETVLRFGTLLGACDTPEEAEKLRVALVADDDVTGVPWEVVPGFSEEALQDLAEELDITRADISELYELYATFDCDGENYEGGGRVSLSDYRDMLMRISNRSPVDAEDLERFLAAAGDDGNLQFDEFVRLSNGPVNVMQP